MGTLQAAFCVRRDIHLVLILAGNPEMSDKPKNLRELSVCLTQAILGVVFLSFWLVVGWLVGCWLGRVAVLE